MQVTHQWNHNVCAVNNTWRRDTDHTLLERAGCELEELVKHNLSKRSAISLRYGIANDLRPTGQDSPEPGSSLGGFSTFNEP